MNVGSRNQACLHRLEEEKGSILVITSITLIVIMLVAALAIDVGCMLTARNQLQAAVDASALAGASGLTVNRTEALHRAIMFGESNRCINQNVKINAADISFPSTKHVQVQGHHNINLFFAPLVGINVVQISTTATAELGKIVGTTGLKPWIVPNEDWPIGSTVVLKAGTLGALATNSGFFYPVDFPPLNRGTPETGSAEYKNNIMYGTDCFVQIGDMLMVEPGNIVGPTLQGTSNLISQDPYAYWDGNRVRNSNYPGYTSPRIIKVPLYNPDFPPDSGKNFTVINGLASFFLLGVSGKDITGIFLEMSTSGTFGSGDTSLRGTRLTT